MEIKGFVAVSLSDWDGRVSSVLFLPGCNLRCPFCYNKNLVLNPEEMPTIPQTRIEDYLKSNRNWIDGVVVTGGEPTLHQDLPSLCEKLKEMGFPVKLDTNGTNPTVARTLIERGLVDYVALDVKAPLTTEKYSRASGVPATSVIERIKETIQLLLEGGIEYEFRTTLVPSLHKIEDVEAICRTIAGCRKYVLQNFKPDVETIDSGYQNLTAFTRSQIESFLQAAKRIVQNSLLRG
jgi:pyruvate formate lyase activating enzyme